MAEDAESPSRIGHFQDSHKLVLGGIWLLLAGVLIGLEIGRTVGTPPAPVPVPVAAVPGVPASPSPPAALLPNDPPPTETSAQTVVEEEPMPAVPAPALPPQAAPPPPRGMPAWQKFALAAPDSGGKPVIAVIIDDMGLDKRRSERVLQLPGPLTISFMSYAEDLPRQTGEARSHGHELMMHVPMEPMGEGNDPGPGVLQNALPPEELKRRIGEDLDRFQGYVGINNHMGSKFTAYAPGMQMVMDELRHRGLLFIDSLTTDHSTGLDLARKNGVPAAGRNVFLDNESDLAAVNAQLARLEDLARRKGSAIAIGHPRDVTIQALAAWLPGLAEKGFVLVPVTAVVKLRAGVEPTAKTHS